MDIIVTDLTRFNPANRKVCIAGYEDGRYEQFVRPMPYLSVDICERKNILPGAILRGDFSRVPGTTKPHLEDHRYTNEKLKYIGPCSPEKFYEVLTATCCPSINKGFQGTVVGGNKVIPRKNPPSVSIITISISWEQIELFRDGYGKDKVHISDNDGRTFQYIPISDLGFYRLLELNKSDDSYLARFKEFLRTQSEIFLRIGLSRYYKSTGTNPRDGFWMQLNGLYTFPDFSTELRTY